MRSTLTPPGARALLGGLPVPWWIAGGWALDLFRGAASRPHDDLDVAILRDDERTFRAVLSGFEFFPGLGDGVVEG
ncbi:MAG TPA: amino acid transporter, partial [Candidatus Thermoplasmatota archaeon]|nr:amino acid transporter [Candidatus Thermoplasmatota archaeon]